MPDVPINQISEVDLLELAEEYADSLYLGCVKRDVPQREHASHMFRVLIHVLHAKMPELSAQNFIHLKNTAYDLRIAGLVRATTWRDRAYYSLKDLLDALRLDIVHRRSSLYQQELD